MDDVVETYCWFCGSLIRREQDHDTTCPRRQF